MESLTRRVLGLAGMGAALASAGAGRAQASGSAGFHGMSYPGRVRLTKFRIAALSYRLSSACGSDMLNHGCRK